MEEQLTWRAFQNGSRDAFASIYSQHYEALLNYGIRFCEDENVVEDTIQDLFIDLWQYKNTVAEVNSIRFYLLRSLRNKIGAHFRKQKAFVFDVEKEMNFQVEFSFESRLIAQQAEDETLQKLQKALNGLTGRQKEILYLRFFNNMDYDQIAEVTGLSNQSARNQTYLAVKALKEQMTSQRSNIFVLLLLIMR